MTTEERMNLLKALYMSVLTLDEPSAIYSFEYCIFLKTNGEITEEDFLSVASSEYEFYEALKTYTNILYDFG